MQYVLVFRFGKHRLEYYIQLCFHPGNPDHWRHNQRHQRRQLCRHLYSERGIHLGRWHLHTIQLCLCAVACIALQDSRENCRQLMGVMANHIQVIAILVIPWAVSYTHLDAAS